ncbi:ribonuclease H-like [Stegodyphus dumicola]|uniref:ribonuclease H-like n=1 Tax=Stegodyphus dumicola TaxID=202533 RepID=UPI0015B23368|nr:ribonuclease H-like [Stegodyphus dumicola]
MKVDKKEMSPEQIRTIALETIEQRFPTEEYMYPHVYTDGSLTDMIQGARSGVFSKIFSFYIPVGAYSTHSDGELKAIHVALQQLSLRQSSIRRAVVLSDSTSVIQAISSYQECKNTCVQQCQEVIKELSHKISFQWVPSHCGIYGNEMADMLAKKGLRFSKSQKRVQASILLSF